MRRKSINNCLVALLVVGSAISLLSCKEEVVQSQKVSLETLMSESSDSLAVVVSENGRSSYRFFAPLVEGYSLARDPYREFRKGIKIITYLNDSLSSVDATLTSNYAIYYSKLKLWEVKGDVVVIKHDGKELYTQQLFWNSTTKRIYSNVDTKIVDTNSDDVYQGEGFESDEEMKEWSFRKMKGSMRVDTTPTQRDSTGRDSTAAAQRPVVQQSAKPVEPKKQERPKAPSLPSAAKMGGSLKELPTQSESSAEPQEKMKLDKRRSAAIQQAPVTLK